MTALADPIQLTQGFDDDDCGGTWDVALFLDELVVFG